MKRRRYLDTIHLATVRRYGWGRRSDDGHPGGGSAGTGSGSDQDQNQDEGAGGGDTEDEDAQRLLAAAVNRGTGSTDRGYPENTPLAEMTVEQERNYWKHQSRRHENAWKARSDYDELKAKADQYDQLAAASRTEHERALDDARAQARREADEAARRQYGGLMVEAAFARASAGRMNEDQLTSLLDGLDRNRFLADDGTVDTDRVTQFIACIAPAQQQDGTRRAPDMGQGRRPVEQPRGVDAGRSLWAERHPTRVKTAT
jgi:hypothetical protein